jgi:hypothetical protein
VGSKPRLLDRIGGDRMNDPVLLEKE